MDRDEQKKRTAETAKAYFKGYQGDKPYDLWRSFDKDLAKDMSLFITGSMYARQKLPHPTRQLVAIASLASLNRIDELKLHIWAGYNVGLATKDMAEAIMQTGIYAGIPAMNQALIALRETEAKWESRDKS